MANGIISSSQISREIFFRNGQCIISLSLMYLCDLCLSARSNVYAHPVFDCHRIPYISYHCMCLLRAVCVLRWSGRRVSSVRAKEWQWNCTFFYSQMTICQVGKLSPRMVNPKSATSISLGYEKVDYTSVARNQEDAVSKAFKDGSFLTSQTKLNTNVKKGRFNWLGKSAHWTYVRIIPIFFTSSLISVSYIIRIIRWCQGFIWKRNKGSTAE